MITNPTNPLEWEQYNNEQYQLKQNPQAYGPVAPDNTERDRINAIYNEMLGRDVDPSGLAANTGARESDTRQAILQSPEYRNKTYTQTPAVGSIARNPGVTLQTPTSVNSGLMPVNPYFQTTNPVQNQYSWAPRSEANPLQGGQQNWGVQQPNQGFNVDQFISEMLGPKAQAQTATLPTPYPGK